MYSSPSFSINSNNSKTEPCFIICVRNSTYSIPAYHVSYKDNPAWTLRTNFIFSYERLLNMKEYKPHTVICVWQCRIINLNYLYILLSTQASKSLKVCSLKPVFKILSATSFISRSFTKTQQIHNAYPCNLYKRHIFKNKLHTAWPATRDLKLFLRHSSIKALLTSVYHQNHNLKFVFNTDIKLKFGDPKRHNSDIKNAH